MEAPRSQGLGTPAIGGFDAEEPESYRADRLTVRGRAQTPALATSRPRDPSAGVGDELAKSEDAEMEELVRHARKLAEKKAPSREAAVRLGQILEEVEKNKEKYPVGKLED